MYLEPWQSLGVWLVLSGWMLRKLGQAGNCFMLTFSGQMVSRSSHGPRTIMSRYVNVNSRPPDLTFHVSGLEFGS